jgi:anti-sigma factor RsiW
MNDFLNPCESQLEAISLLAAGCLSVQEERELREHFTTCAACGERFAELDILCTSLRDAKPEVNAERVDSLATTLMLTTTSPAGSPRQNRTADSRVVILALTILVLVSAMGRLAFGPVDSSQGSGQVVQKQPQDAPEVSGESQPTLLALRRAAAQSDESFDRLLDRYSGALMSEPLHPESLFQESL